MIQTQVYYHQEMLFTLVVISGIIQEIVIILLKQHLEYQMMVQQIEVVRTL